MEASEVVDGLFDRVKTLELVLGEVDELPDDGLLEKVVSVTQQLRRVFREGRGYSEELLQLLELYAGGNHERGQGHLEKLHAILSRYEEVMGTLKHLRKLDMAYREIAGEGVGRRESVVEFDGLQELPALMETCNRLLVRSLWLVQRFVAWNVQCNEFFYELHGRLEKLGGEIDSMCDYK